MNCSFTLTPFVVWPFKELFIVRPIGFPNPALSLMAKIAEYSVWKHIRTHPSRPLPVAIGNCANSIVDLGIFITNPYNKRSSMSDTVLCALLSFIISIDLHKII